MGKIFIILMICYMGIFHISSVSQVHSNETSNESVISEFESLPVMLYRQLMILVIVFSQKMVKLATNIYHLLIILNRGRNLQIRLTLSV